MVKYKILALIILLFTIIINLLAENKELRPYRLIHADSLRAKKIDSAYISELTGNVHFFYGDTEFYSDKAFLFEADKIVRMIGNVKVLEDTLTLTAQKVSYFRLQEKLELEGDVYFMETHQDSSWRTFNAEKVEYLRDNKNFQAWNNVQVFDSRENISANCGYMTYNSDKGYGYLQKSPELQMASKDSLWIKSRKIEYYDDYKKIVAIFDVETLMPDYYLTSNFLIYYSEEDKATYRGEPKLFSDLFDADASEVTLYFDDKKLYKANLLDSCRVDYKVIESGEKENWVTSDEMEFYFKEGIIEECRAYRNIESLYIQQKDKNLKHDYIRNSTTTEKLIMFMDSEGYIEKIGLSTNIDGKYSFESK